MNRIRRTIALSTSLLIAVCWTLFNIAYLNQFLDLDIVHYYRDLEEGRIFHPHHLLFTSVASLLMKIARGYGYIHSSLFLIQVYHIVLSAFTLACLFYFLYLWSRRYLLTLTFTFIFAFVNGYWTYSHLNDTALPPVAFATLTFLLTLNIMQRKKEASLLFDMCMSLLIGFVHFIAVGYHQTNVILYPSIAALILIPVYPPSFKQNDFTERSLHICGFDVKMRKIKSLPFTVHRRFLMLAMYTLSVTFFTASFYLYAGTVHLKLSLNPQQKSYIEGIPGGGSFYDWLLLYGHWDKSNSWGTFKRWNMRDPILQGSSHALTHNNLAMVKVYKSYHESKDEMLITRINHAIEGHRLDFMIYLCFATALIIGIIALPVLVYTQGSPPIATLLWFLMFTILAIWWEPFHFEFWVSPIAASTLFMFTLFLCWDRIWIHLLFLKNSVLRYAVRIPTLLFASALALTLFLVNFTRNIEPRSKVVIFGYWEDIYNKNHYAHLRNSVYANPIPIRMRSAEQEWNLRLSLLARLRKNIRNPNKINFYGSYVMQFENIVEAMNRISPDHDELTHLRQELEALKAGRDFWMEIYTE